MNNNLSEEGREVLSGFYLTLCQYINHDQARELVRILECHDGDEDALRVIRVISQHL